MDRGEGQGVGSHDGSMVPAPEPHLCTLTGRVSGGRGRRGQGRAEGPSFVDGGKHAGWSEDEAAGLRLPGIRAWLRLLKGESGGTTAEPTTAGQDPRRRSRCWRP